MLYNFIMKTVKRQQKCKQTRRRYYGSGATMSIGQAPRLSVEEKLKQKYIKHIMVELREFYDGVQLISEVKMRLQPGASWKPMFMLKKPKRTDTYITFDDLKYALKENDLDRKLFLPDNINKEQWLNTFYSEIAFAYLSSDNYKEFLKKIENRKAEFFMLLETVYLPKRITVTKVLTMGDNKSYKQISAVYLSCVMQETYYETVNNRIYKIECNIYRSDKLCCELLFMIDKWFRTALYIPSSLDISEKQPGKLFDENGFSRLNLDTSVSFFPSSFPLPPRLVEKKISNTANADILLHAMGTHPEAKQTLTPDVVDEIIKLTSK